MSRCGIDVIADVRMLLWEIKELNISCKRDIEKPLLIDDILWEINEERFKKLNTLRGLLAEALALCNGNLGEVIQLVTDFEGCKNPEVSDLLSIPFARVRNSFFVAIKTTTGKKITDFCAYKNTDP